jgi:hypothetical protein
VLGCEYFSFSGGFALGSRTVAIVGGELSTAGIRLQAMSLGKEGALILVGHPSPRDLSDRYGKTNHYRKRDYN